MVFLVLGREVKDLGDAVVGLEVCRPNEHLVWVMQELPRQCLNLLGPGGRPEQGLAVGADLQQTGRFQRAGVSEGNSRRAKLAGDALMATSAAA